MQCDSVQPCTMSRLVTVRTPTHGLSTSNLVVQLLVERFFSSDKYSKGEML
jgi:hypothetical protein